MEMLLTVASLGFLWLFILVEHFHHVAPRSSSQPPAFAALRIWGHHQHSVYFLRRLLCIFNNIVLCAVWYSVVTQTSRAANMAIHALIWRCVCVNKWKWLTKRTYHFKPTTCTLYHGFKDRASDISFPLKPVLPFLTYQPNKCKIKKTT